jgi:hypothetical protein
MLEMACLHVRYRPLADCHFSAFQVGRTSAFGKNRHSIYPRTTEIRGLLFSDKQAMLTEIYIEALLVDKELADQVWELWDAELIPDDLAAQAWCILADALQRRQVKANPIS